MALQWMRNPPPPIPEDWGSTILRIIWAAMAASMAEPPCLRIWMAVFVACGFAVAAAALGFGFSAQAEAARARMMMAARFMVRMGWRLGFDGGSFNLS